MTRWRERWHGSDPQRGSAIVTEAGNLVCYLGGDKETHRLTTAIVAAHNAALSPQTLPGEVEGTREALATCASMLEQYVAECLPADEDGKLHFVRVMTDATAAEIRAFLVNTKK